MASLLSNPEIVHANSRFACFAYFENVPLSSKDHSQFWMVNNNMAFAYPLSNNRTLICLFIVKTAFPEWKNNLEQHYLSFIQSLADAPSLANGTKVSPIYKMMDMPNIFRQPVFQNIAFIGDAAMALDPMSGVGCAFAIQSAAWLVEYTAGPLKNKMPMDEPLLQYENCHKELMTPHATGICADSLAKPMEEDRAAFYQEISNDADLTESFLALTGRIITPHNFHTAYFKKRFKIKPATI
jgi:flavin-dependent dehydrogenase